MVLLLVYVTLYSFLFGFVLLGNLFTGYFITETPGFGSSRDFFAAVYLKIRDELFSDSCTYF